MKSHNIQSYLGCSTCRLCGQNTGCTEYRVPCVADYSGPVVWPEGYKHYVQDHHVLPSRQFFELITSGSIVATMLSSVPDSRIIAQIRQIYSTHCPKSDVDIAKILVSFAGKEAQLLQKVCAKYTAKVEPRRLPLRDASGLVSDASHADDADADDAVSLEVSPVGAQLDFHQRHAD